MTPLKPLSLNLLVALAAGETHAYIIQQRMIEDVQGSAKIESRAVYREIPRLIKSNFVEAIENTYPKRYRLTPHARRILQTERERSLQVYRLLQQRL